MERVTTTNENERLTANSWLLILPESLSQSSQCACSTDVPQQPLRARTLIHRPQSWDRFTRPHIDKTTVDTVAPAYVSCRANPFVSSVGPTIPLLELLLSLMRPMLSFLVMAQQGGMFLKEQRARPVHELVPGLEHALASIIAMTFTSEK